MPILGAGIVPGGASGQELQNLTRRVFTNSVVNLVPQASPTLALLTSNAEEVSGGLSPVTQPVQVSPYTNFGWINPDGAFPLPQDTTGEVNAEFNLSGGAVPVGFYGLEGLVASTDTTALVDRLTLKLNDLSTSMIKGLGTAIFASAGAATNTIHGLPDAYDDGTNVGTYGGLSRTTYPAWKATLKTSAGAILTRAKMLPEMMNVIQASGGMPPDFGIMSLPDWTTLLTDFMSIEQFVTNPGSRYGSNDPINAGFRGLMLGDVPLYFDLACPQGTMYLINSKFLKLFVHQDANFAWTGWESTISQGQIGSIGVMVTVGELACINPASGMQITGITGGAL